jgi:hypothetical protein
MAAVVSRLEEISISGGYQTNLGLSLFDGSKVIDFKTCQDPTCNVVFEACEPEEIIVMGDGGVRRSNLAIRIEIYSNLNPAAAIADVKTALGYEVEPAQDMSFEGWLLSSEDQASLRVYTVNFLAQYDERVKDPYVGN